MLTEILYAGLAIALALLVAILLKVATLPAALQAQGRRERSEGRAEGMQFLQEVAATKVGLITLSLRDHDALAAERHLDEITAADVRARLADARATNIVSALATASELARELRPTLAALHELPGLVAELRALHAAQAAPPAAPEPPAPDSGGRNTVKARPPASCMLPPPPAGEEGEPEDEMTVVKDLRSVPPQAAGSSPSAPQVAAGLGPRPASGPRTATMLGLAPPPEPKPPRRAAPTLLSMQAPPPPARRDGGS
jgi:hypothetical protein